MAAQSVRQSSGKAGYRPSNKNNTKFNLNYDQKRLVHHNPVDKQKKNEGKKY